MTAFKWFGVLAILFGTAGTIVIVALWHEPIHGVDLAPMLPLHLATIPVGVGLWFHRRWAAVLFAAPLAVLGAWEAIDAVRLAEFPATPANLVLAGIFLSPAGVTVSRWSRLRPFNGERSPAK